MNYQIGDAIFSAFPYFNRGVVVARNIDNKTQHSELENMLADEASRVSADTNKLQDPRLEAWDLAYRSFGANPKRDTPSIRFLISQISKGRLPRPINDVVNIFNLISLTYRTPCGGDDLDALEGCDIRLDFATGKEIFAPLFNPNATENPSLGEVIYFTPASNQVMCRRWNWRNAHFSRIRPETINVVINVDALIPTVTRNDLEQATNEVATLMSRYCGGEVTTKILDANTRAFDV